MPIEFPPPGVEQYFRTFRIGPFAVDAEERTLIYCTNMDGKMNLWAMDLERRYPYPFTTLGEACSNILPDPKGRYVIAAFDRDGDENWQVYALPPAGGDPLPLLQAEGEKFFPIQLSEDGRYLYYCTSQGNPQFLNSYRYDLETGEQELLYTGEGATTFLVTVAREGDAFVTAEALSNTMRFVYLHTGGERLPLRRADEPHGAGAAVIWDKDTVYFVTDEGDDIHYLARYMTCDPYRCAARPARGSGHIYTSSTPRGQRSLHLGDAGVADRLYRYDLDTGLNDEIPASVRYRRGLARGEERHFVRPGRSSDVPFNISRLVPGGDWERLTDNRVLGVAPESLRPAEVVRYKSFDGLEIEALLFRPLPEKANGYTVFWPHGGPQWAERKAYRSLFQVLLAAGYTVFAPNFRGSTGYGTRFTKMVERDWGHGPRLDCVAGVEWLIEQGIAERGKLFVVGGSYGGYMTLLLHGRHPEYWRACVDIFGPSNLFTFYTVPDFWKPMMDQWLGIRSG